MIPSLKEISYNNLTQTDKNLIKEEAKTNFIYEHIHSLVETERIKKLRKHKESFLRILRYIVKNKLKFKQLLLIQKMIQDEVKLKQLFAGITLTNTTSIFELMKYYTTKEKIQIDELELLDNVSNFCLTFILNLKYEMQKGRTIYEQQYPLISNKLSLPNWHLFLTLIDKEIRGKYIITKHSIYRYSDPKLWTKYMWVIYYTHQLYYRFHWFSIETILENNMLPIFLLTESCTKIRPDFIKIDQSDPFLIFKIYGYLQSLDKEEFYSSSPFYSVFIFD